MNYVVYHSEYGYVCHCELKGPNSGAGAGAPSFSFCPQQNDAVAFSEQSGADLIAFLVGGESERRHE